MSNKQIVADLMEKLPDDASLTDIAREIEFIAGVREGFAQLDRGEGRPISQADWAKMRADHGQRHGITGEP